MLARALSGVAQALLLEILNIDVLQAAQTHAIIEDLAGLLGMGMDFEELGVASDYRGDASHFGNGVADGFDIEVLTTEQEDDFVAELFFDGGDIALADIGLLITSSSRWESWTGSPRV